MRNIKTLFATLMLAAPLGAQTVSIGWTPPASTPDPIAGYNVYKQPAGGAFALINTAPVAAPPYLDAAVTTEGSYAYYVVSVDAFGVESTPSSTVNVLVPAAATNIAVAVNLTPVLSIPTSFVGISEPHGDVADIGATTAAGINAPYYNLLKNLTVAGANPLLIRVEGDLMSPTAALPGVNGGTAQEPQTTVLPVLSRMASEGWINFILGVDLASNQPAWAAAEVQAYLKSVPAAKIAAFEIGNEPDNYLGQGYRAGVYGAPQYLADWTTWQAAMNKAAGKTLAIEGPAAAGSSFEAATIAAIRTTFPVSIYGQHAYFAGNSATNAPDLLLQPAASTATVRGYGQYVAQTAPVPYRLSEMNSVSGGGQAGISNTFQAALWLIDDAFNLAQAGMAGFNIHTGQYTNYNLWEFTASPATANGITARQLLTVNPPYYGMLVLAGMMGNSAKLLSTASAPANPLVVTWATLDAAANVHVVVLNKSEQTAATVAVTIPGYVTANARLLTAPAYSSTAGITLGGQTFDGSTTGLIQGAVAKYPVSGKAGGTFTVSVPVTSAVVLTVAK